MSGKLLLNKQKLPLSILTCGITSARGLGRNENFQGISFPSIKHLEGFIDER